MRNSTMKLLVLSIVIGWTISIATESHSSDHAETSPPAIEFTNSATTIDRAGIPHKLLWAAITMINLEDEYKLIPLYGYPISELDESTQLRELAEAAAGNVNVAILCPLSSQQNAQGDRAEPFDTFEGRGLRITDNESDVANPERLRDPWDDFNSTLCNDALIALTRPLPDTQFSNSTAFNGIPMEFVTWSGLW